MADQRYLVAARKYRPALFKDVVAQEHVTDTLKNALRLDRLAHAYLFSGPRGVGKTTTARILAKAINCETPKEEREDEAEPCCECNSCLAFEDGRSLNVFEMDAASNNKVDDIRELREKVRIPPQGATKKVYILDEVHMLSKQAFNALLKTLEEPPAHALFIFATTEPHKVLATILSRCQRFDFRRIPVPDMVGRLREICPTEDIEADEESLMLLARKGDGALRDALSAFDQAISLCGTTLEYGDLTQALGVVDQDLYFRLTDHVAEQSTAGVLTLVHHVVRSGYDLQEFLGGLAEHLRHLLVARSLDGSALEEVAEATQARYAEEAQRFREADLLRLLSLAGEAEDTVKTSTQPRLKLEMTLLKMAKMRRSADLTAVLQKIEWLEQMVEDGELPDRLPTDGATSDREPESTAADAPASDASTTAAEPSGTYEPAPTDRTPDAGTVETRVEPDEGTGSPSAPEATTEEETAGDAETTGEEAPNSDEPVPAERRDAASGDPSADPESSRSRSEDASDDADDSDSDDEPSGDVQYGDLFGEPALKRKSSAADEDAGAQATASHPGRAADDGRSHDGGTEGSGDRSAGRVEAGRVREPAAAPEGAVEPVTRVWPQMVRSVKQERIRIGTFLTEAQPVERSGDTVVIAVPDALHRDQLRDVHRLLIDELDARLDEAVARLRFEIRAPEESDDTPSDDVPMSPCEQLERLRESYDTLEILFNQFGAEMAW